MRTMFATLAAVALAAASIAGPAHAQEQQAGNEASTNVEETFRQLIEKCDNTEALMLRARIRLQLGRTTDAARDEATKLMDEGLSKCGEGKMDEAMPTLQKSLDVAAAGVTEKFGTDATAETGNQDNAAEAAKADAKQENKPWWKFW